MNVKKDNIIIKKIYEDNELMELEIKANSEFAWVKQSCYLQKEELINNAEKIIYYSQNWNESQYVEFGRKEGKSTPAFSLNFIPANHFGYVKIEVDMEIEDNPNRNHRCIFYVESVLGIIEQFGNSMKKIPQSNVGIKVSLNDNN